MTYRNAYNSGDRAEPTVIEQSQPSAQVVRCSELALVAGRVSEKGNKVGRVRLSLCLSVVFTVAFEPPEL